ARSVHGDSRGFVQAGQSGGATCRTIDGCIVRPLAASRLGNRRRAAFFFAILVRSERNECCLHQHLRTSNGPWCAVSFCVAWSAEPRGNASVILRESRKRTSCSLVARIPSSSRHDSLRCVGSKSR